ncbi:MAG: ABC transporter substrate-binding protein, partial [Pseudomonadota bacterium]|nr:ABC transporter substrate-binding protein [Pseudomonadota bacterium]
MRPISRRLILAAASATAVASRLRAAAPVRVGSKLDTEAALLGTIVLT